MGIVKVLTTGVLLVLIASLTLARIVAARPNVLMIAVDDLRPLFGQAYGVPEVRTPNMDGFLETGTVMQHSYVQQAVCGPSRASILTGRRPDTTHAMSPLSWCWNVRGNFTTLPHYFRQNGYITAGSGKIFHPDACGKADPHTLGDDRTAWSMPYFPEPECVQWGSIPCPHSTYWHGTMGDSVFQSNLTDEELTDGQLATHAQAQLANFSSQGIGTQGSGDKPFFMAVGFHKPHLPHIAPKKYFDMYEEAEVSLPNNAYLPKNFTEGAWYSSDEIRSYIDAKKQFNADGYAEGHPISEADTRMHRRAYFAATSYLDAQVGRVLSALKLNGFDNNTIVVLWSDHGWHLGDTNSWGKCTNFETGTRNTLMWRVPGGKSGSKSQRLVEMVDLYPTLIDLAGLPSMRTCIGDEPPTVACLQGETYADEFMPGFQAAEVKAPKQYAFSQWSYVDVHPAESGAGRPGLRHFPHGDHAPEPTDALGRTHARPQTHVIGYTVRSDSGYRLTEYLPYNFTTFAADWSVQPLAREFYDYNLDPYETVNQAYNSSYASSIYSMHSVLKAELAK